MKLKPHVKDILLILGLGALVVGSAVAPGLPKVIYYLTKQNKKDQQALAKFDHRLFRQELKRLQKVGDVKLTEEDGKLIAVLTKTGEEKIKRFDFEGMKIQKPSKWDGKWRLIIFDIEEGKKVAREFLRRKLNRLGFYRLQRSVYIHPYPCREEVEILRENYGLSADEVMYLLVDRFEGKKILLENYK